MKKLLIFLLILCAYTSQAQTWQIFNYYGGQFNRIRTNIQYGPPQDTIAITGDDIYRPWLAVVSDTIYLWSPSLLHWVKGGSAGGGGGINFTPGNGLEIKDGVLSLKHITITNDSNVLIGTTVNDGHKLYVKGSPRFDLGGDQTGDMFYRNNFGGLSYFHPPVGLTKPVLSFNYTDVKPYWKEDEGGSSGSGTDSTAIHYLSQLNDSVFLGNRLKGPADTVVLSFTQASSGGPSVTGGSFSGTTTKTLTLTLDGGSTVSAGSFTDLGPVTNGTLNIEGSAKPNIWMLATGYTQTTGITGVPTNASGRLVGNSFGGLIVQGYSDAAIHPATRIQGFSNSTTPTGIAPVIIEAMKPGTATVGAPLTGTDTAFSVYTGHYENGGLLLTTVQANGNMYVKGNVNAVDGNYTNLKVSAAAGASNAIILTDADVSLPNLSGVTLTPALIANTYGRITSVSTNDGGIQVTGFTEAVAAANPFFFNGYHGSTAPTASAMVFRAAKHNGTTGLTTLANTEIIASFRNWTNADALQILGNGDVKITGALTTAAPASGTAAAWKLGSKADATVTLDTTKYIQVEIGGVSYKLALVQ